MVNLFMLLVIPIICHVDKKEKRKSNQAKNEFIQRLISLHKLIIEYWMTRLSGEKTYHLKANFEEALNIYVRKNYIWNRENDNWATRRNIDEFF